MDPLTGEWVIIAGGRQLRPSLPEECPFCIGGLEAPEAYTVKAFTNRWPVLRGPGQLGLAGTEVAEALTTLRSAVPLPAGDSGSLLHPGVPALGEAEVVLYTPKHHGSLGTLTDAELRSLWALWTDRTAELSALDHVAYVLIFENRGTEVGVTIEHPHGQIYGFPFVPPRIEREIEYAAALTRRYGIRCPTCELTLKEAAGPRLVYEDDHSVAYVPYAGAWPYALHLVPKGHVASLPKLDEGGSNSLMRMLRTAYGAADMLFDRPLPTMMAFLQGPSLERDCTDSGHLDPHMRIELVSPMRKRGVLRYVAGAEVATSVYQNPVKPEDAARAWRQAFERAGRCP